MKLDRDKLSFILKKIPLFKGLSSCELDLILDMPKSYSTFSKGEIIVKEGDKGDTFFILLQGKAAVWRHDRMVNKIEPPQFIGEVGFIVGDPRIATVTAESELVVVMKITPFHFKSLPGHIRECIKDKIIEGLVRRLEQTTDVFSEFAPSVEIRNQLIDKYAGGQTL